MSLQAWDHIYRTRINYIENGLVEHWSVERWTVESVEQSQVVAGGLVCCSFPSHTPPEPIVWLSPGGGGGVINLSLQDIGTNGSWQASLTLPDREAIDDSQVESDYLDWVNRKYVAQDLGRAKPIITEAQRRLFLIHEYRQGLLAL